MELTELYENLLTLTNTLGNLLDSTYYKENKNLPKVEYDQNNADECMLYDEICSIFTHIDFLDSIFAYLQKPIAEEGTLQYIAAEKHKLNQTEVHTNDVVEILLFDKESGKNRWRPVLLRPHSNLNGKTARIRAYK